MDTCDRDATMAGMKLNKSQSFLVRDKVTTIEDLIKQLHNAFATDFVDVDHVQALMAAYKSNLQDWKKYAKFDRYRYTRNLVDEGNGRFNLIVLCWGEGHGSAIHDHAGAHCVMKVLQGELCETRYAWPDDTIETRDDDGDKLDETSRSTFGLDDVCYINDAQGLHRIENLSAINPAVSLHLYSPPFDTCTVFNKQTGQRLPCKVTFWSRYGEHRNRNLDDWLIKLLVLRMKQFLCAEDANNSSPDILPTLFHLAEHTGYGAKRNRQRLVSGISGSVATCPRTGNGTRVPGHEIRPWYMRVTDGPMNGTLKLSYRTLLKPNCDDGVEKFVQLPFVRS